MSDGKLIFETGIDTKGLEKEIKGIKNITVSVDGSMDVSKLKKRAKSVSLPEIEVSVDLTEAEQAMEELDSGGGKLKEFATGVFKKNIEKLTQGGVIGVIQGVAASVTDAAKAGDEVDKTSKKLNMSRKGYQEWSYVLERNGASAKSLQSGMAGLNGVVEKARSGNADAAKQFEKLGIEVGKLDEMSGEELFEAAVAGLQGMDDEGEKAALATALFGDSAVELIPTLSQTAEETAALKQEAHDLGAVMSDDMVNSSVALNEHVEAMSTAWQGLTTQLATIVMPLFTGLFEGVTAVIGGINTLFSGPQKSELETAVDNIEQDFNDFKTTVDTAEQNYNDTVTNIATRKDLADKYLAVLDELGKKEVLTDEDTEAIRNATIALTNLYPDLKDDIDAETGLFKSNTQAIRDNIQAINDHAMAKAAQTLHAQFDEQRIVTASNLVEATTTVRMAEEEYDAAVDKNEKLQAALDELKKNDFKSISAINGKYIESVPGLTNLYDAVGDGSWVLKKGAELYGSEKQITEYFESAFVTSQGDVDRSGENLRKAQAVVDGYNKELDEINQKENEAKKSLAEISRRTVSGALDEYNAALALNGEELEAAKKAFEEKWDVEFDRVEQLLGEGTPMEAALLKLGSSSALSAATDEYNAALTLTGEELAKAQKAFEKNWGVNFAQLQQLIGQDVPLRDALLQLSAGPSVSALEEYNAALALTGEELEAAQKAFEKNWQVDFDALKELVDGGMGMDAALLRLNSEPAVSAALEEYKAALTLSGEELSKAQEAFEKNWGVNFAQLQQLVGQGVPLRDALLQLSAGPSVTALEEYNAALALTGAELEAAQKAFEEKWQVDFDALKELVDGGMGMDAALLRLNSEPAVAAALEEYTAALSLSGEELAKAQEAFKEKWNLSFDEMKSLADGGLTPDVSLQDQVISVEQLAADIQTALDSGKSAEQALADAKTQVTEDAAAILDQMKLYVEDLGTYVDAMTGAMVQTVADAKLDAAKAGSAFAQGMADGYRGNPAPLIAAGDSARRSLDALRAYYGNFAAVGASLVQQLANGVSGNGGVLAAALASAVSAALAAARAAAGPASRAERWYGQRTGLEYVPYDEYPALLHKGESVLTASEAALWRGGMYALDLTPEPVDYRALAEAIWQAAPEDGGVAVQVSLDGTEVAHVLEPRISQLQGRRLASVRR